MSRRQRIDCRHERRPGMAVCLHCLHEARVATRERRQRTILRFAAWTIGLTVVGVVATAGANAVVRHPEAPTRPKRPPVAAKPTPPQVDSTVVVAVAPVMQQGAPAAALAAPPAQPVADTTLHAVTPASPSVAPPTAPVDSTASRAAAPAPAARLGPIPAHG